MTTYDYASAYDFIAPLDTTTPYRIEFRYPHAGPEDSPHQSNPAGQLLAVVKGRHPRRGTIVPISRPGVHFNDVDAAIDEHHWPLLSNWYTVNLAEIQRRIHAAGLD